MQIGLFCNCQKKISFLCMRIFKTVALLISMRGLKVPGKINHVRISVLAATEPRGGLDNALEK